MACIYCIFQLANLAISHDDKVHIQYKELTENKILKKLYIIYICGYVIYIYIYVYCIYIAYILHINPPWSVLEHWIYCFIYAISRTVMHRLTNWRKCIILIFVRRFIKHRPIDGLWTSRGRVVSNIESYHLFASVICVNAVCRHSAASRPFHLAYIEDVSK